MAITQLDVPQWKEPSNADDIVELLYTTKGKLELWQQLPLEWQISEEGQKILQQINQDVKALGPLMSILQQSTFPKDLLEQEAAFFEYLVERCDVVLDKQPDNRGLKLLRGRIRNWLKQYQIYQQQGGDGAELNEKYKDIEFTCRKYPQLFEEQGK